MQFERTNIDIEIINKRKIARNNIDGDNTENNEEEKRLEIIRVNTEREERKRRQRRRKVFQSQQRKAMDRER